MTPEQKSLTALFLVGLACLAGFTAVMVFGINKAEPIAAGADVSTPAAVVPPSAQLQLVGGVGQEVYERSGCNSSVMGVVPVAAADLLANTTEGHQHLTNQERGEVERRCHESLLF